MLVQILIDNVDSWVVPMTRHFIEKLKKQNGQEIILVHKHKDVLEGDILVLLSCNRIYKPLNRNKHNLVAHASALPKGKGMSPLTWQILEGKSEIPVTLFEAQEGLDSGEIYEQVIVLLKRTDLIDDARIKVAEATFTMIERFIEKYPNNIGEKQKGEESYYNIRGKEDSRLDFDKSISDQFNLLRVVDNERYPAYFDVDGERFILKIFKA
ncbi:MAG: formyltransferase family protein [Bacteroidota bacterium]|nr:formyltransferase family protein [Bacteroidota bacterium]